MNEPAESTETPASEDSGELTTPKPENAPVSPDQAAPGDLPASVRSPLLMSRHDSAVLVVDVQKKLLPHVQGWQALTWNIRRLLDAARILGVPRLATEQYPAGLGTTVPDIAERLTIDDEKSMFSCRDCENVRRRLEEPGIGKVLVCGIETHVCVQQTALDLLAAGLEVWIAADAVGSRFPLDRQMALRRMESSGVNLTTTESVLFEWCEDSAIPEFKRISQLVREEAPEDATAERNRHFPRIGARYLLQTDHRQSGESDGAMTTHLCFIVRDAPSGRDIARYEGRVTADESDPRSIRESSGIVAVEMGSDGTSLSLQHADGTIEMVYLPIGDPQTSHPRWKIRRLERHINSPEYQTDYEITFHVVEYVSGDVFREFHGFEHRDAATGGYSHISGVRQVEVSADGHWLVITTVGRPPELMELPAE